MALFKKKEDATPVQAAPTAPANEAEVAAAIGLAVNLYLDSLKAAESSAEIVQKVQKTYSSWSAKHLLMRKHPRNWQ